MPKSRVYTERSRSGFTTYQSKTPVHGFTLIELLVTIAIIAILSAIALVAYSTVMKQGRDSKRQADLRSIQSALEQYNSDQGFYPVLTTELQTRYINTVPTDSDPSYPYCYISLKKGSTCTSASVSDCDNLTDSCVTYCLYAKLDNPIGSYSCNSKTYTFELTPP